MQFTKKLSNYLAGFVVGVFVVSFVGSQTDLSIVSKAEAQATDEIIVTARKRAESIQDVPVAVSAISPEQLEKGNVKRVQDLMKVTPNVVMQDMAFAGGALSASIRGLAFDDLEKSFEPTVAVVIDGVVAASNAGVDLDLFDIEAIEVLRGPQGTLFGRNTIGGVINIKRTKPTGELGAKVKIGVEEDNTQDLQAVVNLPIGEKAGLKIAMRDFSNDSFMYNVTRQETRPQRDLQTYSISLGADLTDNFYALLTVDNYDDSSEHNLLNITPPGWAFCAAFGHCGSTDNSAASDYTETFSAVPFLSGIEGTNLTLNLEWEGDNYTFKSISGHNDFDELMDICSWGGSGTAVGFLSNRPAGTYPTRYADAECVFPVVRDQTFEQKSQEFQLISDFDGALNYILGAYFLESTSYMDSGPIQNFISQEDKETQAFFGELYYDFSDVWGITLGARYTEEDKELDTGNFANYTGKQARTYIGQFNDTFTDDNLSYRVILERNFDQGMVYASYTTGFRSGGWQTRGVGGYLGGPNATNTPRDYGPYESEEVESIELGLRSELNDGKLVFNATAFMADYNDKQEVVVTGGFAPCSPTCTFVVNAGDVEISGLELDAKAFLSDRLTVNAAIGILDSEYKTFDYNGTDVADDSQLIFAPESTVSLGFDYDIAMETGDMTFSGNLSMFDEYTGRYTPLQTTPGLDTMVPSHEALDLSLTYTRETDSGGTMKIVVFGNDILEEGGRLARPFDAAPSFTFASPLKRQHFGMSIGYEF
ncbi:MAG: TonB-dependent receptor [Candidatus Micropelagos thuwalensis]